MCPLRRKGLRFAHAAGSVIDGVEAEGLVGSAVDGDVEAAIAGDGGIDDDQCISSGAESVVDLEMDRESELWLLHFDSEFIIWNKNRV